ncbi:MAG TPA: TonB-dependent receptor, partial [Bryobacteraceae bacterium]
MLLSRVVLGAAFCLSLMVPLDLLAQTNAGILSGTVVDQTGATIPGAKVTAKNPATGSTFDTVSGADGGFRFPSVAIGKYDVTASATGFETVTQSNVTVTISQTTAITITLNIGKAEQTVTVQADVTSIETQSSEVGTAITSKQVVELPLALGGVGAMRSPEAFVFLAPGTAGPGTANSNNGIFISKIGGGQNFGNEVLLDGSSILRTENGSSFDEAAPSVEAIAEFRVLTSTIPATYGRTTGGIETFTTKSGTNQFHGTAYDILQNEALNSNSWFNNGYAASCTPQPDCRSQYARPIDKKNDYGVNLGGPVWIPKLYNGKNRTFFFFNWEQYKQNIGGTNTSIVPTAAQRNGDFSSILTNQVVGSNPCTGQPIYQGQIFDPTTTRTINGVTCRDPFPNNKIPASMLSTVSQNMLSYLPLPNIPALANGNNFALSSSTPLYNTTYTIRIDQSISDKNKIFAMYDSRDNERYTSGTLILPPPVDPNGWRQSFVTHYARAGWDYIISPTVLNHLVVGYNRTNSLNLTTGAIQARQGNFSWPAKLGIAGINGTQFPIVNIGEGVPALSRGNNDDNLDNGERFNDTLSWVKGKHNLTFGFDFRNQLYGAYASTIDSGVYNFSRNQTAGIQNLSQSGNSVASFMLGGLNNMNATQQAHAPRWTSQYYAAFIQDDWKVSNHLTLNLGLRYDVDVPRVESYDNTSNFDPNAPNPSANNHPGAMVFANTCGNCNRRWADTKFHDVGPRIGFAYNPGGGKTVFRGGYGIIYSPLQYTDFGGSQVQGFSSTPVFPSPDGFGPAFDWDQGVPAYPHAPLTDPSIVNKGNPNYIQPRFGQPGIIQSWSFQVQRQLSKDTVATLGYAGQRAQNLRSAVMNVNNIPLSALSLGSALKQPFVGNTLGIAAPYANFVKDWGNGVNVQQALRPFPQYGFIYTDVLQNIGQSTYNSLQASVERRFSAGLQLQASFTWSKTITDADSILPGINGGITQIQNPGNLQNEKALSSQDVPYMFSAAPLWELPFGKGKPWFKSGIG